MQSRAAVHTNRPRTQSHGRKFVAGHWHTCYLQPHAPHAVRHSRRVMPLKHWSVSCSYAVRGHFQPPLRACAARGGERSIRPSLRRHVRGRVRPQQVHGACQTEHVQTLSHARRRRCPPSLPTDGLQKYPQPKSQSIGPSKRFGSGPFPHGSRSDVTPLEEYGARMRTPCQVCMLSVHTSSRTVSGPRGNSAKTPRSSPAAFEACHSDALVDDTPRRASPFGKDNRC
eukprot:scaffold284300_cov30-Tisochrysis_lutea.AAC.3